MYKWDKLIGSVCWKRIKWAQMLGMDIDELMSIGREAAMKAECSWRSDGGSALSTWIYRHVEYRINTALARAAKELDRDDEAFVDDDIEDLDSVNLIKEAVHYLRAHLPDLEWYLLWLAYAEGRSLRELSEQFGLNYEGMRIRMHRLKRKSVTILSDASIVGIGEL